MRAQHSPRSQTQDDRLHARLKRSTDHNYRGFDETPIWLSGHRPGLIHADREAPRIYQWRMNLTALSRRYNLFFVASVDTLLVYQPELPDQSIGHGNHHCLQLPRSSPNLLGHIPNCDSHGINNLIIQDLGEEEVLVCACDDGDIVGYETKRILLAVQSQSRCDQDYLQLRHFFHANCGRSAWGLAVQTEARLIAASSNTHAIHVWAPALVSSTPKRRSHDQGGEDDPANTDQPGQRSAFESTAIQDWSHWRQLRPGNIEDRSGDNVRVLRGHHENIPSISFCNTDNDLTCKFLLSASIDGSIILWNVTTMQAVRRLEHPHDASEDYWRQMEMAGWSCLFLDRRYLEKTSSLVEATGVCRTYNGGIGLTFLDNSSDTASLGGINNIDISDSIPMVKNAGSWFLPSSPSEGAAHDSWLSSNSSPIRSHDEDTVSLAARQVVRFRRQKPVSWEMNVQNLIPFSGTIDGEDNFCAPRVHVDAGSHKPNAGDLEEHVLPKSPVLVMHAQSIHLWQTSSLATKTGAGGRLCSMQDEPLVCLHDPMEDDLERPFFDHMDRLNMTAEIPELGVVIVGAPRGRAVVLTLHKLELPASLQNAASASEDHLRLETPICTMRLDHILPTKQQEREKQRPLAPLVGIAAGPVISQSGRRSNTRWRLLLYYADHTMLAYELGRPPSRNDGDSAA